VSSDLDCWTAMDDHEANTRQTKINSQVMNKFSSSTSYSRETDFTSWKFIEVNEQFGFPVTELSGFYLPLLEFTIHTLEYKRVNISGWVRPRPHYAGKIWKGSFISTARPTSFTLIGHENGAVRKRSANRRNLKTLALRFSFFLFFNGG